MRKSLLLLCLLSLSLYASCGGSEPEFAPIATGGGDGPVAGPGTPLTATIAGKITFEGTAPAPRKIQTSADPACMNPNLVTEEVVVSDGGLENVIVYVSSPLSGMSFPTPQTPVVLDQQGCHYIPHALTLQTNQQLKITNSDNTAHNVHAWAEVNTPFNESQARQGIETTKTFTKEEIMLPVRCDVHNWMNAYIGVFNHALHTVSKAGGAFEIKMPPGKFEITAQHEKYGKQTQMVDVPDGGTVQVNFTFSDKPAAD